MGGVTPLSESDKELDLALAAVVRHGFGVVQAVERYRRFRGFPVIRLFLR